MLMEKLFSQEDLDCILEQNMEKCSIDKIVSDMNKINEYITSELKTYSSKEVPFGIKAPIMLKIISLHQAYLVLAGAIIGKDCEEEKEISYIYSKAALQLGELLGGAI